MMVVMLGAVFVPPRLRILLDAEQAVILEAGVVTIAQARPERPSGALPHRIVANLLFDLGHAHAGVVVPGGVVGAHMIEAEPIELVQRSTRPRRAMLAGYPAAGMV